MIRENEDRPYARGGRAGCASACRDEGEFALIDRPRGFAIAILLLGEAMPLAAQQAPALAPMPVAAATPSADVSEARARALAIVAEMTLDEKRSDERRVGKECVSTCSSRGSTYY